MSRSKAVARDDYFRIVDLANLFDFMDFYAELKVWRIVRLQKFARHEEQLGEHRNLVVCCQLSAKRQRPGSFQGEKFLVSPSPDA